MKIFALCAVRDARFWQNSNASPFVHNSLLPNRRRNATHNDFSVAGKPYRYALAKGCLLLAAAEPLDEFIRAIAADHDVETWAGDREWLCVRGQWSIVVNRSGRSGISRRFRRRRRAGILVVGAVAMHAAWWVCGRHCEWRCRVESVVVRRVRWEGNKERVVETRRGVDVCGGGMS